MLKVEISFADPEHNIVIIKPEGSIDSTTVGDMKQVISKLVEEGRRYLIIDFTSVDYISSAGWGIILGRLREFRNRNGDIYLVGMRPPIFSVFQLMGLNTVINYFETLKEAAESLGIKELEEIKTPAVTEKKEEKKPGVMEFETIIKEIIIKNPLWGAREIARVLPKYGIPSVGWLKVYKTLRRLGLHTQKRRLLFAVSQLRKE